MEKNFVVVEPYIAKPRVACEVPLKPTKHVIYKNDYYYDEDGQEQCKPGETLDLIVYLKASQASTDIANIIARLQNGDETVINVKPQGLSGDVSQLPHNVNDINNLSTRIKDNFDKLPDDVRKLFKDPADFVNAVLDNKLNEVLKDLKIKVDEPKPAPTNNDPGKKPGDPIPEGGND